MILLRMSEPIPKTVGAVVLAAGKGTRLGATTIPKVMSLVHGKPLVSYTVDTLHQAGFSSQRLCLVVGFARHVIEEYFSTTVSYAVQTEQLGTAHAAYVGMKQLPPEVTQVLVMGGDDSAFYSPESLINFVAAHQARQPLVSVLTAVFHTPPLVGRVIRTPDGRCVALKEKEQLTAEELSIIKEINTGTYCIDRKWFESIFPTMPAITGLGEYGLNQVIELAIAAGGSVLALPLANAAEWFGVNTPEELAEADRRKRQT